MISHGDLGHGRQTRSRGDGTNVEQLLAARIKEHPATLGLGDMDLKRVSWCSRQISLLLENSAESVLFVVEVQLGATDEHHLIRLVERWLAERNCQRRRHCSAVLVAQEIPPRYLSILQVISRAVPLLALEMELSEGPVGVTLQFRHVGLR